LYNKIANIRKDFVHKSSNDLSKNQPSCSSRLVHQEYVEVREGQPGKPRQERQAEIRLEA